VYSLINCTVGNFTNMSGNCTNMSGNCSYMSGNCTNMSGNCSNISGNRTNMSCKRLSNTCLPSYTLDLCSFLDVLRVGCIWNRGCRDVAWVIGDQYSAVSSDVECYIASFCLCYVIDEL
jgi:hypothetical protein